jgi:hypothetical protein
VQIIKYQHLDHWQYQYLDSFGINWTASPTGRSRLLVCSQKTRRKGTDAVRRSPYSRNYKTGRMCRQNEDPLIQNLRTHQHYRNSAVLQTARSLKTEVRRGTRPIKDRHSRHNKRKMGTEEDAWAIVTQLR